MIRYAVYLDLDADGTAELDRVSEGIGELGPNIYVPPERGHTYHLTLAVFDELNFDELTVALTEMVADTAAPAIGFSGLAIFAGETHCLYAQPYFTPALMAVHQRYFALPAASATGTQYFPPDAWAPHVTFALGLTTQELSAAVTMAAERFTPFACRLNRIRLTELDTGKTLWSRALPTQPFPAGVVPSSQLRRWTAGGVHRK